MLRHLQIKDFAVIEELELGFDSGMTIFTGETGAGKSIIVDALGLVLGDRADSTIIRKNCEKTEITAILEVYNNDVIKEILAAQDIAQDNELLLRRTINRDGRSRAYVNGTSVTAGFIRDLGEQLIDIHGQHAHQSLLKQDVQRALLDEYGQHGNELKAVRESYQQLKQINRELEDLLDGETDRSDKLSLLEYQVNELEMLNLGEDELESLEDEYKKLSNISRILESGQNIYNSLAENENSIRLQLYKNTVELNDLQAFDEKLMPVIKLLEDASIQINEASDELRHYLENTVLDPERLRVIEDRITTIHDLSRKHKIHPRQLVEYYSSLSCDLEKLRSNESRIKALEQQKLLSENKYLQAASDLHNKRKETAARLSREITETIKKIGMPGGKLEIQVLDTEKDTFRFNGTDKIEYLVVINPGQDLHPLNKVASGGELSRISLAIQVIASKDKGIPTLIFDEVDSGIGGGIAEIVGKLLHDLAANRQVFCVTHLPQVASLGDHHLLVNKTTLAETTLTQVVKLNREQRIEEIARMLGGIKITDQSRAHAEELLQSIQ